MMDERLKYSLFIVIGLVPPIINQEISSSKLVQFLIDVPGALLFGYGIYKYPVGRGDKNEES